MKSSFSYIKHPFKKNNITNNIAYMVICSLIVIEFIQIDLLNDLYILDIPKMTLYSNKRIVISMIFKMWKIFGVDNIYIVSVILFSIIVYIPIGIMFETMLSNKNALKICTFLIYMFLKFLISNYIPIDILMVNLFGILIGHWIAIVLTVKNKSKTKKGCILFIFALMLINVISFKQTNELFVFDLAYSDSQKFYFEKNVLNGEFNETFNGLIKPYIDYKNDVKAGNFIEGYFEGMEVSGDMLSIKISGDTKIYKINSQVHIIDKQILDSDNRKIFLHYRFDEYLDKDILVNRKIRLMDRMVELVNARSKVILTFDEKKDLKYICLHSYEYRG